MQGLVFKARVNAAAMEERPAEVFVLSDGLRGMRRIRPATAGRTELQQTTTTSHTESW